MTEQTHEASAPQSDLPEWLDDLTRDGGRTPAAQAPQKISAFGVAAIFVIAGLLAVIGYAMYQRSLATPTEGPAPAFAVTMYTYDGMALSGEPISLDALHGKAVVVNFWASYCVPCQQEARMLERVWQDYRDLGVVFLGVNTEDPQKEALDYLAEYGVTYPNAPDQGAKMEKAYRITGIPETFVISTQGEIVRHFISTPNERDLRREIDRALDA